MVTGVNEWVWSNIEEGLTPLPPNSDKSRLWHYSTAVLLLPVGIVTGSMAAALHIASYALCCFSKKENADPMEDFSEVLKDSRKWEQISDLETRIDLGAGNPDFLFGTATCTYQDSGAENCQDSQWPDWEKEILPEENRSGSSANLFQLYQTPEGRKEITDRLHLLGVNSYRFSIEWSHIEPEEGVFNLDNLQIYVDFCRHLRNEGIAPMITLHHFSEPKWFHEKGSFENEANITDFLAFAERVFPDLTQDYNGKPLVEHFCTINEPAIEAFSRFIRGSYSPGITMDFGRAGSFLKGALKAHCLVYDKLKELHPGVNIGIVHQYLSLEATNPLLYPTARYLNRLINETALNFFKTGTFELKIPLSCHIVEEGLDPKTDFVGLQYYVRAVIGFTGSTSYYEPMTEMPYREDPEGLYEAITKTHEAFQKPIIVTENGISTHNDQQRSRYMQRALYATQRAKEQIGEENLLGYYAWSFCDNFEWDMGMSPQAFGIYGVEDGEVNPNPKPGADSYIRIVNAWRRTFEEQQVA